MSELVGGSVAEPVRALVTPAHSLFKRSLCDLEHSFLAWGQEAQMPKRPKGAAAREGIRFERKVISGLLDVFGALRVLPGPLFHFVDQGQRGVAIPDALLFSPDFRRALVVEVKLRHRVDAFYQLTNFYLPIVRMALPCISWQGLEVCCFFDPAIKLPVPTHVVSGVDWNLGAGHSVLCTGKLRGKGGWSTGISIS